VQAVAPRHEHADVLRRLDVHLDVRGGGDACVCVCVVVGGGC
jgi:hypothetical protein